MQVKGGNEDIFRHSHPITVMYTELYLQWLLLDYPFLHIYISIKYGLLDFKYYINVIVWVSCCCFLFFTCYILEIYLLWNASSIF